MSQYSLVDLFSQAQKLHSQYEQQFGRKMAAPNHVNASQLFDFQDSAGRNVSILLEARGDRHALTLFGELMRRYEHVLPQNLLFIVEGFGRKGFEQQRYSPQYIAEEMAKRYNIAIAGGIAGPTEWDVIAQTISELAELKPPIGRKSIIGSILLSEAWKNPRRAKRNLAEAVENLIASWNSGDIRVMGISELYAAVDRLPQITADEKPTINRVMQQTAKESGGKLDLEEWGTASRILEAGGQKGITRDKLLASIVDAAAPISERGFPDYLFTMSSLLTAWGSGVGREELHKCLMQAQTEYRKAPEAFRTMAQKIGQVVQNTQNQMNAERVRKIVGENRRIKNVLVVADLAHDKGIRAGFKTY